MPAERPQWLPRLVIAGLLALLALAAWQWHHGPPLSTDLLELVPGNSRDALQKQAEQRMQEPLNRELIVLVGYPERDTAIARARKLAEHWQASGLYEKVQWGVQADLPALREQLRDGRLALLNGDDRQQLAGDPTAFIQQRVEQLFDPFSGFGLVPNDQDWFGLALRIQHHQPLTAKVQLDIGSGALIAEADGRSWVLLRARTRADAFDMNLPRAVAAQIAEARRQDLLTTPYVFNPDEARAMAGAGADIVVAHMGVTTGGAIGAKAAKSLDSCCAEIEAIAAAAKSVKPDVIVLCHGGPIAMPEDAGFVLDKVRGCHGFYGASSMERLPVEVAIKAQVEGFKGLRTGK